MVPTAGKWGSGPAIRQGIGTLRERGPSSTLFADRRASRGMTSVPREFPLSYAVRSEGRRCGSVSAVHESNPAGPAARASPPRRATMRSGRSGSRPRSSSKASLRPRPDRRATRRLCRRGRARPGEASRRNLESRAKGLAVALRPRGRARPERPHRRRTRIQQWMPGVERRESPCRCPGDIQVEMFASTVGCRHPIADDGVAVE